MNVLIRYDPDHGKGLGPRTAMWTQAAALVDTGADLNYADPSLLRTIGCPVERNAVVAGATSTISSQSFVAHLLCQPSKTQLETDVVATPLLANGRSYNLVLGSLFLQQGALVFDFIKGEFYFDWKEQTPPGGSG